MKKTLIQVRNLAIGHKDRPLFADISFDICEGDVILLCGANGSGKTTLLKALTEIRSEVEIAMIPTRIPKIKGFTLNEFINLSCYNKQNADSDKALKKLALSHLADRDISTLSDGEFQKGTIAAAIAKGAEIILMDEPTAFLDFPSKVETMRLLKRLAHESEKTIFLSTHDLEMAIQLADDLWLLSKEGLQSGTADNLSANGSLERFVSCNGISFDAARKVFYLS